MPVKSGIRIEDIRPQVLFYTLLKHSTAELEEEYVIDQAIDRLSTVTEALAEVSAQVQATSLMRVVQVPLSLAFVEMSL